MMPASVPCSEAAVLGGQGLEGGQPRQPCLSSDYGSEANDAFPNALALDRAVAPNQIGFLRSTSKRIFRACSTGFTNTDDSNPRGQSAARREDAGARFCEATRAESSVDTMPTAVPSRPAEPRPSRRRTTFTLKARDVSRKFSKLMGGIVGARASGEGSGSDGTAAEALDWKPHENISRALKYRPRGFGQRFSDIYGLGKTLGTGGFGVVQEGR